MLHLNTTLKSYEYLLFVHKSTLQGKLGLPETFDGPDVVINKVKITVHVRVYIINYVPAHFHMTLPENFQVNHDIFLCPGEPTSKLGGICQACGRLHWGRHIHLCWHPRLQVGENSHPTTSSNISEV